jgi:hypothetical protein
VEVGQFAAVRADGLRAGERPGGSSPGYAGGDGACTRCGR